MMISDETAISMLRQWERVKTDTIALDAGTQGLLKLSNPKRVVNDLKTKKPSLYIFDRLEAILQLQQKFRLMSKGRNDIARSLQRAGYRNFLRRS